MYMLFSRNRNEDPSINIPAFEDVAQNNSNWKVTSYSDRGIDKTTDFNGYTFIFEKPGNVIAIHNGLTETGNMIKLSNDKVVKYELIYSGVDPNMGNLTNTWSVITNTQNELVLRNPQKDDQEEIHFVKADEDDDKPETALK